MHPKYIEIMQEIKENSKKLDSCKKHDFSIDARPDRKHGKTYRCSVCGGEVDAIHKYWYEKGLEHANENIKK